MNPTDSNAQGARTLSRLAAVEAPSQPQPVAGGRSGDSESLDYPRMYKVTYALAVAVSIAVWFVAIRSPLWLDECSSYWQISAGFGQIMARQGALSPAYSYILWFASRWLGTSEVALRIPSVLAMLGAVYMLYRAAREILDRDAALITAVVFCIHPIVIFTSIDARPYAFAALAVNSAVYLLVRLRHSDSNWLAAGFGLAAAAILYFHFLFGAILPALVVGLFAFNEREQRKIWRESGIALAVFALALLPLVPDLLETFHGRETYVFDKSTPRPDEIGWTLVPGWALVVILGVTAAGAVVTGQFMLRGRLKSWRLLFCVSLALFPLLLLYGVSLATPLHIFMGRYRLVAVPGIALCWGFFASRIRSRLIRVLFCFAVVAATASLYFKSPELRQHGYTWKYALEVAEKNATPDNAPMVICSDFPSADYVPIPKGAELKDSPLFTPLSYYKVPGPVVGLPRALNEQAMAIGRDFVSRAASNHERFVVLAYRPSYPTLRWLEELASGSHTTRKLGTFDGVSVVEFDPRRN